jgi:hypothetical protein
MRIVLIKRLADEIDGVSLRGRRVGEAFDLPPHDAGLLLAEQWAIPDRRGPNRPLFWPDRGTAPPRPPMRRNRRLPSDT